MRLLGGADVDAADHGGVLRKDVDQPFFAQLEQRVADGGLADAELLGQLGAGQHGAGHQVQRHDGLAQFFKHLGRGMARAVQADFFDHFFNHWHGRDCRIDALIY